MMSVEPNGGPFKEAIADEELSLHALRIDAGDVKLHQVVPAASLEGREEGVTRQSG